MQKKTIEEIYFQTSNSDDGVCGIKGNLIIQVERSSDVQLVYEAIVSAFLNQPPVTRDDITASEVALSDGTIYKWSEANRTDHGFSKEDLLAILGIDPFLLVAANKNNHWFRENVYRSLYELTQGKILNVSFVRNSGFTINFTNKESQPITSLSQDTITIVCHCLLLAAMRSNLLPFFIIPYSHYNHEFAKRFIKSIIPISTCQVIFIADIVRSYATSLYATVAGQENWQAVYITDKRLCKAGTQ